MIMMAARLLITRTKSLFVGYLSLGDNTAKADVWRSRVT
jgi:hypothetical protein